MQPISRAEYDRLRRADEPLPKANVLIEPDGRKVDLYLTPGQTVARTNPRMQKRDARDALTLLADLTEAEGLCASPSESVAAASSMVLGNLIESGQAYQIEFDAELIHCAGVALFQLECWLKTPEAAMKQYMGRLFRAKAEACVRVLRAHGF